MSSEGSDELHCEYNGELLDPWTGQCGVNDHTHCPFCGAPSGRDCGHVLASWDSEQGYSGPPLPTPPAGLESLAEASENQRREALGEFAELYALYEEYLDNEKWISSELVDWILQRLPGVRVASWEPSGPGGACGEVYYAAEPEHAQVELRALNEQILHVFGAVAKRAYFAAQLNPGPQQLTWLEQRMLRHRRDARSARPEIVRVRCGHRLHRIRLTATGGPVVLLDHLRINRKAELAMCALGAPWPDCLLVLDALTGRITTRSILWRRRAFQIATDSALRKSSRRPGSTPALEQSLVERYARFVRHRAELVLTRLLPADSKFEVRVVPPPGLPVTLRPHGLWSWRRRPGIRVGGWRDPLSIHVPFDWVLTVERPHADLLQTDFILESRVDRRGRMINRLQRVGNRPYSGTQWAWTTAIDPFDSTTPVSPRRWQRAWRGCIVTYPPVGRRPAPAPSRSA
jgi:hypothetical protein